MSADSRRFTQKVIPIEQGLKLKSGVNREGHWIKTQKVIPIEQGLKHRSPFSRRERCLTQKVIPIEQGLKQEAIGSAAFLAADSEGHSNRTRIETRTPARNRYGIHHSEGHSNRTRIETHRLDKSGSHKKTQKVIPIEQGLKR